jgi:hypothetical protein
MIMTLHDDDDDTVTYLSDYVLHRLYLLRSITLVSMITRHLGLLVPFCHSDVQ